MAASSGAQPDQRLVVPLSHPSRPAVVDTSLFSGDIVVKAYDGKEVVVVTDAPVSDEREAENPLDAGLDRFLLVTGRVPMIHKLQ